jgi:hypothetical protein
MMLLYIESVLFKLVKRAEGISSDAVEDCLIVRDANQKESVVFTGTHRFVSRKRLEV